MASNQSWQAFAIAALGIAGTLVASGMQHYWSVQETRGEEFEARRREAYVAFLDVLDKKRVADKQDVEANTLTLQADAADQKGDTRHARALREEAEKLRSGARDLGKEFELQGGAAVRRIAVYGDKKVVEAYANYARAIDINSKGKGYGSCFATWKEDVAVYQAIRKSSMGPNQDVKPDDLAFSALFCDPEKGPTDAQHPVPAEVPQAALR